ncbi:hypothetical protein LEUCIP111803_00111 [Leucobacter soli]|uniref:Cell division protein FtsL n=2 Tax=Leucobacter soli TaxID=2812850 RepID=A0A916JRL8_9MICO|nr:hypothetical protein [Leucobacter soli]CAG7596927.1 hypothetical protein LEUCIP111803_00111 [Leucobacter soli]
MSTTAALEPDELAVLRASAAPQPTPERERRHLRPVRSTAADAPARRGLSPLLAALSCGVVVVAILATQLGLSIAVSQGAYEVRALELEQRDLARVERVLSQNVDKLSSPQNLAENAAKLGMVQNATPATLRLSDHKVLGSLTPRTSAVNDNLVPNAALDGLPVVNAEGLLVARNGGQAAAVDAGGSDAPVAWRGKLPAPDTH